MAAQERLQKVLARGGIASRRAAEELITAGRVRVNGKLVTELGTRVDPKKDKVELDGRLVRAEPLVYYAFHKPRGVVSTLSDPEGRPTLAEYLKDLPARVFPVGRLDFHTSGALLLTNDGELAQALLHPKRSVPKTYVAKVKGVPTDLQLEPMRSGLVLEPVPGEDEDRGPTRPADVDIVRHSPRDEESSDNDGTTWLRITLREGRNRQIHRMAEAVGLFVMRLARLSFAGITNDRLRPGERRTLSDKEITALRAAFLRPVEQAKLGAQRAAAGEGAGEDEETPAPRKGRAGAARGGENAGAEKDRFVGTGRPSGSRSPGAEARRAAGAAGGGRRAQSARAKTAEALRGEVGAGPARREERGGPRGDGPREGGIPRRDAGSERGRGTERAPREGAGGRGAQGASSAPPKERRGYGGAPSRGGEAGREPRGAGAGAPSRGDREKRGQGSEPRGAGAAGRAGAGRTGGSREGGRTGTGAGARRAGTSDRREESRGNRGRRG